MKFPIVASIGVVTAALAAAGLAGDGELPRGIGAGDRRCGSSR